MHPKVSIIIPVYNVSNYIEKCVHSLFRQTLNDVEFIFVDDCSTDNSMEIVKSLLFNFYPQRIEQTKMISHDKNRGSAAARNTGLAQASGEYIGWVDSDDWVETDMFEELYHAGIKNNADIVECDFMKVYQSFEEIKAQLQIENKVDYIHTILQGTRETFLWNKIIRRSLFYENDIHFIEGANMAEDKNVNIKILCLSNKIQYVRKALYYYTQYNSISLTRYINPSLTYEEIRNAQDVIDFFVRRNILWINEMDVNVFKLNAKKRLLFSGNIEDIKNWKKIFPEVNLLIYKSDNVGTHHKMIAWMCMNQQWWALKLWTIVKWINKKKL